MGVNPYTIALAKERDSYHFGSIAAPLLGGLFRLLATGGRRGVALRAHATLLQELLRGLRARTEGGDFESLLPCERPGKCKSFFLQAAERGETHFFANSSFAYLATAISPGDLTGSGNPSTQGS